MIHWPPHLLLHAIEAAVVVVVAGSLVKGGARFFRHLEHRPAEAAIQQRRATLYRLLTSVLRYTVDFVAILTALDIFGVPTTSLVAGAGIVGLAVSFGAQGLVQDIVTGLFLLYEDQYRVGDKITLPALNLTGVVTELGLRVTRLAGPQGELTIVPNRLILEVQNHSREQTLITVKVPLDPNLDPHRVESALTRLAETLADQIPGLTVLGIQDLAPGQVVWALQAPAEPETAAGLTKLLRHRIAGLLYEEELPLAGQVKGYVHGQNASSL
ncbi:small-conductance mechanosensitive channel [Sulfobacillus acidophilus TPY]|uniref:MscS Mechanosensitive ion channel n=1 Tax=Sulfobacillus acidophilus (strain ATCC 700253 / DSM 10332 / NAL) TaxID=679936 RepID=G8TUY3_SULAD|nr:small-conductance mechanosensitive channel [Sulfobacillus acidophilus TPY]AEW06948.1 MscS Mechanosensitive ion channel [Sulfobacillus acidophilus DSM 10332]